MITFDLLIPLITSFGITALLIPLTIRLAKKLELVDDPRKRKHPAAIHKTPIPRAGGFAIFIAIAASAIIFLPHPSIFTTILFAGLLTVTVGLLDDKYDLSPYVRFFTNIVAAAIVVFKGVTLSFITNPFGGILHFDKLPLFGFETFLPMLLAILWIVWVMNMLNWSKGVDGQMPGIAAISAITIGIASLRFPQLQELNTSTAQMAFITGGAALGFLIYNIHPARIFPGYSSTILGFTIAILSLLSSVKLATALLVMGLPAIDAVITVARRVSAKKSPFWHDKGHLHHLLLDIGLGQRTIAVLYWAASIILGMIALNISSKEKIFAIIVLIVVVGGGIISLKHAIKKKIQE